MLDAGELVFLQDQEVVNYLLQKSSNTVGEKHIKWQINGRPSSM